MDPGGIPSEAAQSSPGEKLHLKGQPVNEPPSPPVPTPPPQQPPPFILLLLHAAPHVLLGQLVTHPYNQLSPNTLLLCTCFSTGTKTEPHHPPPPPFVAIEHVQSRAGWVHVNAAKLCKFCFNNNIRGVMIDFIVQVCSRRLQQQ